MAPGTGLREASPFVANPEPSGESVGVAYPAFLMSDWPADWRRPAVLHRAGQLISLAPLVEQS